MDFGNIINKIIKIGIGFVGLTILFFIISFFSGYLDFIVYHFVVGFYILFGLFLHNFTIKYIMFFVILVIIGFIYKRIKSIF